MKPEGEEGLVEHWIAYALETDVPSQRLARIVNERLPAWWNSLTDVARRRYHLDHNAAMDAAFSAGAEAGLAALLIVEKQLEEAREALRGLVQANEAVCAGRSQTAYDAMIDTGQGDALLALDRARALAASTLGEGGGEGSNGSSVAGLPSSQEGSDTQDIRQAGKED